MISIYTKIKNICFNEYLGSFSDTATVFIDYNNIYLDREIIKGKGQIKFPQFNHTFSKSYVKDDSFIIDFSLSDYGDDNLTQIKEFKNSKDYDRIFKNLKSTDDNINSVLFKRKNDLKQLSVPQFIFDDLFRIKNTDFVSYQFDSKANKSNQTYLYNINYGVVKAGISETRAYEAIKDKKLLSFSRY